MPTLCAGLGFTTTIEAQLLTVPGGSSSDDCHACMIIAYIVVYAIAALTFVTAGILSDRWMRRYPFMMFGLTCNLIGYIILCTAPQVGVRYAGIFIASMGLYIPTALNNLWAADNHGGHFKRATTCGTIVFVGSESHAVGCEVLTLLDIAGAVIGFVFTSQTSPRYFKGIYFVLAFTIMSMGCTTLLVSLDDDAYRLHR